MLYWDVCWQCFLEMADLDIAETMVSYYTERPPKIGQRSVHVRYSNYDHLNMENNAQVSVHFTWLLKC